MILNMHVKSIIKSRLGGGGGLNRGWDEESGGGHWHTQPRSNALRQHRISDNSPEGETDTHTPSDSDEEGVGETPYWAADHEERAATASLMMGCILITVHHPLHYV